MEIRDDDLTVPGEDIDLDGGVTSGGGVTATITKGPVKVPLIGKSDLDGTGSGTWQTMGGLVECTGSWSAKCAG